jgi:hypothetical protein|tara:strand:+ start:2388 stop:2573 length:186 start_codon:yes stop_codon:yes gene_type:complete
MSFTSANPALREHIFYVIPPKEPKMTVRMIASSAREAKEKTLKKWPEAKILLLESREVKKR